MSSGRSIRFLAPVLHVVLVAGLAAGWALATLGVPRAYAQTADDGFYLGASLNSIARALVLQADGKIVVVGAFTQVNGVNRTHIGRINADGTLDAAFNPHASSDIYTVALQADGKIIVGGWFTNIGGKPRHSIARLKPDGTLDAAFSPNLDDAVGVVAVQSDGKIVVAGWFNAVGGQTRIVSRG